MTTQNNDVDILLVEDNPTDAELAMLALKERNLANNLVWVKDGAQALDFIFAKGEYSQRSVPNGPKVILLDLRLPKVDGLEVLRHARQNPVWQKIPIVVMTTSR
jgi:two-component system response regulator